MCPPCIPNNPCACHEGWVCKEDPALAEQRRREQAARRAEAARAHEEAVKRQAERAEQERAAEPHRAEERAAEEAKQQPREQPPAQAPEAPPPIAAPRRRAARCHAGPGQCCLEDGTIVRPCGPIGRPGCDTYTSLCGSGDFCHACRCLPPDARVLTPTGEVELHRLRAGDAVVSLSPDGRRVRAIVLRVAAQSVVAAHEMIELRLEGGRTIRGSALHPLADGRLLGELTRGVQVDGSAVISAGRVPFSGDATWDLLPSGETGIYFVNGIPLRTTLGK